MISLTTAKLLLFIALCLGPKYGDNNHTIEIVNKNSYCVWTQDSGGWTLVQKGHAAVPWPSGGTSVSTADLNDFGKDNAGVVREIRSHDWSHNAILNFSNGDIVEKQGANKAFYTINAGGYNQQIYTIQTMENGEPL